MCTVTFLPTATGFLLTSNRDETPERSETPVVAKQVGDVTVSFPKDPKAGGSWYASDQEAFSLVLLNGGFEKHKHRPPYRLSRGLVLLDFFKYRNVSLYANDYNFNDIEPFTLLIVNHQDHVTLDELIWDGHQLHHQHFEHPKAMIWSSSTLRPSDRREVLVLQMACIR